MVDSQKTPNDWVDGASRADATWVKGVRALRAPERRAVLDAADRRAVKAGEGLVRARDVYEVLASDLEPENPIDAARVRRLLDGKRSGLPGLEALFARVAAACADPELGIEAATVVAQHAVRRGDFVAADRLYAALFVRVRGHGGRAEAAVYVNFARFCLRTGREFEGLAASRRAEALFIAVDEPWGIALARLHRSALIQDLHDWVRLPAAIAAVEELLPRLSVVEASLVCITLHDRRAHDAWARGRIDEAISHVDAAEALLEASDGVVPAAFADPRAGALLRVLAFVAGRRFVEARALADRALAGSDRFDAIGMSLRCARLEVRSALLEPGVEREAISILEDCEDPERPSSPGRRRELATRVARVLAGFPPALRTMRRAFDIAATAAFERAVEVDRFVRESPEAAPLHPDDAETLSEHRQATLTEQAALGTAVALALERAAEEGRSPLPMFAVAGGLTCVCAWCQRVRTRDGVWLTVQQFLPLRSGGPVQLTHGICDACIGAVAAQSQD